MVKLRKILEYAMKMELDAKEFYRFNVDRVESPSIKKMFNELVEMEEGHYAVLKIMHERLGVQNPPVSISWVVDDVSKEVNLPIIADNSDLIADDASLNDLSIVRLAYLMEGDFALFYKNAAEKVESAEAREFLVELASWEKQHEKMFRERYHEMLKKNWDEITDLVIN
jgi:rubrerythrin